MSSQWVQDRGLHSETLSLLLLLQQLLLLTRGCTHTHASHAHTLQINFKNNSLMDKSTNGIRALKIQFSVASKRPTTNLYTILVTRPLTYELLGTHFRFKSAQSHWRGLNLDRGCGGFRCWKDFPAWWWKQENQLGCSFNWARVE